MNEDIIKKFALLVESGNDEGTEIPGDPPVYYTQVWLNQTYGNHSKWVNLVEDGITGWGTIKGLIRALQIYLGTTVDADFGNGTKTAFQSHFAATGGVIMPSLNTTDIIYGIIAGALWCKGYYGSFSREITGRLDERGSISIIILKSDAGLNSTNNYIDALLMKSLLSMDQFVLLKNYGGTEAIRSIQKYLNANYGSYVGIIPCDGLYQRDMNKALIKVLQYVEGFRGSDVDGVFGNETKNRLPQLSSANQPADAVRLYCFCLTCNGYPISGTSWTSDAVAKTKAFQAKYLLPVTGLGDTNTWMSLLLSKGNSARNAAGCDCATILDSQKANALYNAGYRYVGRYLSGYVGSGIPKALTQDEMSAIFNAGLSIFAIYQEGSVSLSRYTYETGLQDAENAITAAIALNIPMREYIYFAVDYDVMDGYIEPYVVPYFQAINEVMATYGNKYLIGIYGSRNVCSRTCFEFGLASSSFVGDMSTGYSGNTGYTIPENWAFDQFHEFTFTGNGVSFPLDKDAVSGQYLGCNSFAGPIEGDEISDDDKLDAAYDILSVILSESVLGSRVSFSWEAGPFTIQAGPVTINAYHKYASLFNISEDHAQYSTYNIKNGNINGITWSATEELYDSLDANFKTDLGLNGWSSIIELAQGIENGKVSVGTKVTSAGQLTTYIVLEQYLGSTETTRDTVSVKFEFIMDGSDGGSNLSGAYNEAFETAIKVVAVAAIVVAVAVVVVALLPEAVIASIAAFFAMLGSWFVQIFQYA